jgi:hypothetical protein
MILYKAQESFRFGKLMLLIAGKAGSRLVSLNFFQLGT